MNSINLYGKECTVLETLQLDIPIKAVQRAEEVTKLGYIYSFVVNAYRGNNRSSNVKLKHRGDVRGGGKKPWKQKGTGRARQGSIRAPHWVGGGAVFGPQQRNYNKKINKKVLALFLLSRFLEMVAQQRVLLIEPRDFIFSTKLADNFVNHLSLEKASLILRSDQDKAAECSFRNLPNITMLDVHNIDLHRFYYSRKLVFTKETLLDYMKLLNLESYNSSEGDQS